MSDLQLYYELQKLPANLKEEVKHYIEFLASKAKNKKNQKKNREFGILKGQIKMNKDFDAPLDGFNEYMP